MNPKHYPEVQERVIKNITEIQLNQLRKNFSQKKPNALPLLSDNLTQDDIDPYNTLEP